MKYFPLVWTGLWRKPARTLFTFVSITAAFVLFGILMGLDAGFAHAIDRARADRLLVQARFGGAMPISYRDQIAKIEGVTLVAPITAVAGIYQDPKNPLVVVSRDESSFRMWPEFPITAEQAKALARTRAGTIISKAIAEQYRLKVGDRIPIQSRLPQQDGSTLWTFDVVAVVGDVPGLPRGYMLGNYAYLDEARSIGKGYVGMFGALVRNAALADETSRAIDDHFANGDVQTRTVPERTMWQSSLNGFVDIQFLTGAIIGATMFMLLFLTGNVMMQSVRERIPEFAVMKTIGFPDVGLLALVLLECAIPSISGALIGLAISQTLVPFAGFVLPAGMSLPLPELSPTVFLTGICAAILVAFASSVLPAWRLRRLDVVDALAGG